MMIFILFFCLANRTREAPTEPNGWPMGQSGKLKKVHGDFGELYVASNGLIFQAFRLEQDVAHSV